MTPSFTCLDEIPERLASVRARVVAACERAGRDPATVTLVAVTKSCPPEAVAAALAAGVRHLGENRVHEALSKMAVLSAVTPPPPPPTWHLIGHLQTNKVRAATGPFAILHAVDSERLLHVVAAAANQSSHPQKVMIEVNVAAEPTKFGVTPGRLPELLAVAASLPAVDVLGLMTVAPHASHPEDVRPVFRQLAGLARAHDLSALSMGMSDDFAVAVEEGATHLRLGRAVFGERQP
ncbi:MAG: YggS family pyridoxal phosphate-dependent enzyme [Dehalococcoidia bacterium]|nr:YggS family pyridoxal phosphate-dependent enzyme [Dehalococcoidia bacterium]